MDRIKWLDSAAGLMICWMIFIHCLALSGNSFSWLCLLGFFMPWFFFKSGMMYRPVGCKILVKKDVKKLIYPYIIYSAIGFAVFAVINLVKGGHLGGMMLCAWIQFIKTECVPGNDPLWFLISLFVVKIAISFLSERKISPCIIAVGAFLAGFVLSKVGWQNITWWFGNMSTGLSFFAFGYLLRDKQCDRQVVTISASLIVIAIVLWLTGVYEYPYYYMHANIMQTGEYLFNLPVTLAGMICMNAFFRYLQPSLKFRILNYVGRNSMDIYVVHWIVLTVLVFVANDILHIENTWTVFTILAIGCIVLLPIIVEIKNKIKKI